jgi:hypothetical protein
LGDWLKTVIARNEKACEKNLRWAVLAVLAAV